jgi:hypothetical protein
MAVAGRHPERYTVTKAETGNELGEAAWLKSTYTPRYNREHTG